MEVCINDKVNYSVSGLNGAAVVYGTGRDHQGGV